HRAAAGGDTFAVARRIRTQMMIMATAIPIDPMLPHPYSVREVGKETPDTFTLTLEPENADNGSTFQPGQFSMLWVFGVGELPISISGDPALHDRLVYTVRSVGQATHSLVNGRLVILYGGRSPRDLLYRKELATWARKPDTHVLVTVDYGGLGWRGHVGIVTTLFKYSRLQPAGSVAMVCGPEIMMRFVARELETQGLSRSDIYLS